ncbi:MAG: rhomboid family intramembrane serine protease [Planctomycetota bacterium]|nr:MAG: rhomboid family intramembrane serine protease [Planctomycetota bacterium]
MRLVGKLTNARDAERFSQYLEAQGIRTRIERDDGEVLVWVLDEDQVARAREAFQDFCASPTAERFRVAGVRLPARERTERPAIRRRRPPTRALQDHVAGGAAMLTRLLVIHVAAFIAQNAAPGFFEEQLQLVGRRVLHEGEFWRLFTYGFLHDTRTLAHIGWNMFGLWMFGRGVAPILGARRFLAFYLGGIAAAGVVQMCWDMDTPVMGASGGVTAVVMLCATLYPTEKVLLFFVIPLDMWLFACLFVLADAWGLIKGSSRPIAYAAHLGGAAFGLAYWFLFLRRRAP